MGEKIKNIDEFKIGDSVVKIELNNAYSSDYIYDIHLQTSKIQFSLKDGDFIKLAAAVKKARVELEREKNVKSSN